MKSTLMKLCLQFLLIFVSSRQSIQKESCTGNFDDLQTSLRAVVKEFDFRHPIIYHSSKFMELQLLMELNSIGQYSGFWQSNLQRNSPVLVVVKENLSKELQFDIQKMKKALIILIDVKIETIMDKVDIKIDQEVYFFQVTSCEVYEQYEINDIRLKQRLGYLQNSFRSGVEFIWEENVQKR